MSVLKIQILVFPKCVCFGSQTEDESGSEKEKSKEVGSSGKVSDLYLRGVRAETVHEFSQTF
jgi:hypothetical protein